jgi:phage terminase large subunit GpA-like protein
MTPKSLEYEIFQRAARGLKPPPRLTVSQWADANRYLSAESSADRGKWRTDRAPYQRGMMDALSDPSIETVVIMSSAQIGKTEVINNIIGFYIDQDPSPILVIMPTLEMGEAWSKDRLSPMLRDTPCLRGKLRDAKSKDSGNTLLHKVFNQGHITIAGANSPASLSSRPIRIVCCDEVDRYPQSAGAEGDPVNLAFKRATTFWNRKRILTSTPTIRGASRIESAYEASDQRRFYVPCPRCDQMQVLQWRNLRWPDKAPDAAYYECGSCRAPIHETEKMELLRRGVWVPEKPGSNVAGFHISELYSPWVAWAEMAKGFIEAKKLPETLKTWINTSLGETWEEEGEILDGEPLYNRREDYEAEVPAEVAVLTAGVDVQDDRIEFEVVGFAKDAVTYGIDYVTIRGNPATPEPWIELDRALMKKYTHELGTSLGIACAFVDSGGHHTQQVYRFCKPRSARWVYAVKGVSGAAKPIAGRPTKLRSGALLFPIGVDTAKENLYSHLRLEDFGPGYCHFPKLPQYDIEYFRQLTAEKIETKYKNGFPTKVWVKRRPRNEALDCRVYAMAALEARRVDLDRAMASLKSRANKLANPPEPEPVIAGAPQPEVQKPSVPKRRPVYRNTFVTRW